LNEAISQDLVFAQVETEGGSQRMAVLILHAVPFWLAGIDPKRVRQEIRPEILRYQREVVDVLYAWAQSPKTGTSPAGLVPVEQIAKPEAPADDAGLEAWREYHRQMVLWIDWQHDIDVWRGSVESRLESLEEVTNLIPEILERLGPQTLTPDHQRRIASCKICLCFCNGNRLLLLQEEEEGQFWSCWTCQPSCAMCGV